MKSESFTVSGADNFNLFSHTFYELFVFISEHNKLLEIILRLIFCVYKQAFFSFALYLSYKTLFNGIISI